MKQIIIISSIVAFVMVWFFYVNSPDDSNYEPSVNNQTSDDSTNKDFSDDKPDGDDDAVSAVKQTNDKPVPLDDSVTIDKAPSESSVLSAVKKYVANNFKVAETSIVVDSIHGEDWPDGCLGLPKSGEACTEMIVFGYEVELKFLGQERKFRTNQDGSVIREEID